MKNVKLVSKFHVGIKYVTELCDGDGWVVPGRWEQNLKRKVRMAADICRNTRLLLVDSLCYNTCHWIPMTSMDVIR